MNKRIVLSSLLVVGLMLTGCGKDAVESDTDSRKQAEKEWTYVASFQDISGEEGRYNMIQKGSIQYWLDYPTEERIGSAEGYVDEGTDTAGMDTTGTEEAEDSLLQPSEDMQGSKATYQFRTENLADGNKSDSMITVQGNNAVCFQVGEDGAVYILSSAWNTDVSQFYLAKYDRTGAELFQTEITSDMEALSADYVDSMAVDHEGRIYLQISSDRGTVLLYDENGKGTGNVTCSNWIQNFGTARDGNVYLAYTEYNTESMNTVLNRVDFASKSFQKVDGDFHVGNNNQLTFGGEYDLLTLDDKGLYGFKLSDGTSEEVFQWAGVDVDGSCVRNVSMAEDGTVYAITEDWNSAEGNRELITLTKKQATEIQQKEEIVMGVISADSELRSAVAAYNRENDQYRIIVREYLDTTSMNQDSYKDAATRLLNDITSSGSCPDIVSLMDVNYKELAQKGAFADLGVFLDQSGVLKREDFLPNLLKAYEVDGKLVSIPRSFGIDTLVAKKSDVGDRTSWTPDDMIQLAKANPKKELLDGVTQQLAIQYMMMFNEDRFVNRETGECSFDSEEFQKVLEFAAQFPAQIPDSEYEVSTPAKFQNGTVLMYDSYFYDFTEIQMVDAIVGEDAVFLGYPTFDGMPGIACYSDDACGIMEASAKKEQAWDFLVQWLQYRNSENPKNWWRFPSIKKDLQLMLEKSSEVNYITDENGEVMLDENGEPLVQDLGGTVMFQDDWTYTYHTPTREECDRVMDLIEKARPIAAGNSDIVNIIMEEAEAYFKGQKTVEDVANVIQSRIQILVDESR